MKNYFIAKKNIDSYSNIQGDIEYEHITIKKIKILDEFMIDEIISLCNDKSDDDGEELYFNGINYFFDDLYSIDVDKFILFLECRK
jgi:hypothetical protein